MSRRMLVGVVGSGDAAPGDRAWELAYDLGTRLVDAGHRVLCGGRGGVMSAVAQGARDAPRYREGDVVAVLPTGAPADANDWVDIAIPTNLGHFRNGIVAQADAVVAIGGGAGTLSEMAMAWIFGRPVLAFRIDGWSGRLADLPVDDRRLPTDPMGDRVYGVDRPTDVIRLLGQLTR